LQPSKFVQFCMFMDENLETMNTMLDAINIGRHANQGCEWKCSKRHDASGWVSYLSLCFWAQQWTSGSSFNGSWFCALCQVQTKSWKMLELCNVVKWFQNVPKSGPALTSAGCSNSSRNFIPKSSINLKSLPSVAKPNEHEQIRGERPLGVNFM
jgi:hypothetical protein